MATMIRPRVGTNKVSTGASKFNYKGRTPEQVRERASQQIGGRDSPFDSSVQFFTPAVGDNTVRILPPHPDSDWGHYGLNLSIHYKIGADESAYLCLDKHKGEPCPICEERSRAAAAGEDDFAQFLRAGSRVAVYVIDRAKPNKGPLIWNMPAGMDKDIVKLSIDPRTGEVLAVDHPDEGYDLSFSREGSGMTTKYKGLQFDRKPSPLSEDPDDAEKWLNYVIEKPIDSLLNFHTYEHIAKALSGQPPAPEQGADAKADKKADKAPAAEAKAQAPAAGGRARIQPRGAAAHPAPEVAAAEAEAVGDDLPTWEQMLEMDDGQLGEMGEALGLDFGEVTDGFDDVDAMRTWVAEKLGIEIPKPAPAKAAPSAAGASWRDKLKAKAGK